MSEVMQAESLETTQVPMPEAPAPREKRSPVDRISALLASEDGEDIGHNEEKSKPSRQQREENPDGVQAERQRADENPERPDATAETEEVEGEQPDEFPTTLSALAEQLNVPVEKLYGMKFSATGPDGQPMELSVGQFKDHIAQVAKMAQGQVQAQEFVRSAQQQAAQMAQAYQQRLLEADALVGAAEQQLMQEYQQIRWDELRNEDPGEFAAKQSEFQNRAGQLQNVRQQAIQAYQMQAAQAAEMQQAQFAEWANGQRAEMLKAIPEWSDPKIAAAGKQKVGETLRKLGFSEQEVGNIHDHRLVVLGNLAARYFDLASKMEKPVETQRLRPAPARPPMRSAAAVSKKEDNDAKVTQLRGRLRSSGKIDDAAALLREGGWV